ncbi:MAG: hypothetical protein AB8H80_13040 [Planctomycetota bacterium]
MKNETSRIGNRRLPRIGARALACIAPFLATAATASAQCDPIESTGFGPPGTDDFVRASHRWDPDGPGPLPEQLLIAGEFHQAGPRGVSLIAAMDPVTGTYDQLPNSAFTGTAIYDLATLPNGRLVACGALGTNGGTAQLRVAQFDGQQWSGLGAFPGTLPQALAVLANGDLVVGSGQTISSDALLHRWDGSQWSVLATFGGTTATQIQALHIEPGGDLIVGGFFSDVNGTAAANVARFDGTTWSSFGSGTNAPVLAIANDTTTGSLILAGQFTNIDGVPCGLIAQQSGSTWTALFPPAPAFFAGSIRAIQVLSASGNIVATGDWTLFEGRGIGIYGGPSQGWRSPGEGLRPQAYAIGNTMTELADGRVLVAGKFQEAGGVACRHVAVLDHNSDSFEAVGSGTNGRIDTLVRGATTGAIYAGGNFEQIEGADIRYLARRAPGASSAGWQSFAPAPNSSVHAILEMPNGDVIIGGSFTSVGSVLASSIALWDGSQWQPVGNGFVLNVSSLVLSPTGEAIVTGIIPGVNGSAFWNGTSWSPFGFGQSVLGANATIELIGSVQRFANGDLAAIATLAQPGIPNTRAIVRYDGQSWSLVAPWPGGYGALMLLQGDELLAGDTQIGIQRWDGTAWLQVPALFGRATFAAAPRADGQNWLAVRESTTRGQIFAGSGDSWQLIADSNAKTLLALEDGSLLCGGSQHRGAAGSFLTRIEPTCPALTTAYGAGCAGAGGIVSLQADGGAWTGGTAVANADGMLPGSLALPTLGLSPQNTPLTALLAEAYPGCALWHSTDLLLAPLAAPNGTASSRINIPAAPALAGQTFRSQVASLEFDPNGIAGIATSNGLLWVIGSF